jgi:hypothetical protein
MWLSRDEEERQRELEKLIDWEVDKQLAWLVVLLTGFLGLIAISGSKLVSGLLDFSNLQVSLFKWSVFIVVELILFSAVDFSFWRLANSLAFSRNLTENLPSALQKHWLINKAMFKRFYGIFVKQIGEHEFSVNRASTVLVIIFGDLILGSAIVSALW